MKNIIVCFAVLGSCGPLLAQRDSSVVTRPIPLSIEDSTVASKFYLRLEEKTYDQAASVALRGAARNSAEGALREILEAIRARDIEAYMDLTEAQNKKIASQRITIYRRMFGPTLQNPHLTRCFFLGGMVYFVFSIENREDIHQPFVPVFLIKDKNGYKGAFSKGTHPVCQNISALIRAMYKMPEAFAPVQNADREHEMSLLPLFGEEESHPVDFLFNGCDLRYVAYRPDAKPHAEKLTPEKLEECPSGLADVLRAYTQLWASLDEDRIENYLAGLGPRSRQKLTAFLSYEKTIEKYKNTVLTKKRVRYVLASDDLYYLVITPFAGEYSKDRLSYDIMRQTPRGEIHFVNAYMSAEFDALLQSPQFSRPFIRKFINNGGAR